MKHDPLDTFERSDLIAIFNIITAYSQHQQGEASSPKIEQSIIGYIADDLQHRLINRLAIYLTQAIETK